MWRASQSVNGITIPQIIGTDETFCHYPALKTYNNRQSAIDNQQFEIPFPAQRIAQLAIPIRQRAIAARQKNGNAVDSSQRRIHEN